MQMWNVFFFISSISLAFFLFCTKYGYGVPVVGFTYPHLSPFFNFSIRAFVFVFLPNRGKENFKHLQCSGKPRQYIQILAFGWAAPTTTSATDGTAHRPDGAPNRILSPKKKSFAWLSFGHNQASHRTSTYYTTAIQETRNVQLLLSLLLVISNHQLFISLFLLNLVWTRTRTLTNRTKHRFDV